MAWYKKLGNIGSRAGLGYMTLGISEGVRAIGKKRLFGGADASTNPSDYATPLPHQDKLDTMVDRGVANVEADQARQRAEADRAQWQNVQQQQAQQLQAVASGQQKGAGELAAERQAQNALAAQHALASMRGAGGGGQIAAARQAGAIGSSTAGLGRQAAVQDQAQAQQLLAGIAGQNQQLQLQGQQMNNDAYLKYLQALTGMDQTQLQAQLAAMQAATGKPGLLGPMMSAGGQVVGGMMMSDERLKTEISDAEDDIDAMLDALRAKKYRYRDEARHGTGARFGILAQDLQRSAAGRETVVETREGLGVDVNKALSAALASAARLNERVRKLEQTAGVQDVRAPDAAPPPRPSPPARDAAIGAR